MERSGGYCNHSSFAKPVGQLQYLEEEETNLQVLEPPNCHPNYFKAPAWLCSAGPRVSFPWYRPVTLAKSGETLHSKVNPWQGISFWEGYVDPRHRK